MKKLIFSFVFVMIAIVAFAQEKTFNEVFRETVELNRDRFTDINVIQPGDVVLLPAKEGVEVEYWVADYPVYASGGKKYDCIWRIVERYMNSELTTLPVDTFPAAGPIFIETPEDKEEANWLWLWILLAALLTAAFLYFLWRENTVLDRNQVVPGGLSDDVATAVSQIQGINPGARIARVERGTITGARRRIMMVMFNNGPRMIVLTPGRSAYRVTELDDNITYYLQHCGNLVGVISNGRFALPQGWSFIPDSEANSSTNTVWERQAVAPVAEKAVDVPVERVVQKVAETPVEQAVEKVVEEAPIIPAPTPTQEVPASAVPINFVDAIKAIGEMKVMPAKMTIKNGELDITVEFDQNK